jgi:hypothetical protein
VIHVNQEQLDQVHYILEQGSIGNHLLFDPKIIKRALSSSTAPQRQEAAEQLMEQMILRTTLPEKKLFLDQLSGNERDELVRVYLNLVGNICDPWRHPSRTVH